MTLGIFARTQNYLYLNQFLPSFAVPKTKVSTHALEQQMWDRPLFRHAQGHLSHDFDHEEVEVEKGGKALHVFTISKKFLEGRGPRKKEGGNHANGVSVCVRGTNDFFLARNAPQSRARAMRPLQQRHSCKCENFSGILCASVHA